MAPKDLSLLLVTCSILLTCASVDASAMLGGWQAISNLTDPKVVEIAEFAVKEHNKNVGSALGLVSIVQGETQMVNGVGYRLIILARGSLTMVAASNFRVVVWDKPWKKERRLISFQQIAYV